MKKDCFSFYCASLWGCFELKVLEVCQKFVIFNVSAWISKKKSFQFVKVFRVKIFLLKQFSCKIVDSWGLRTSVLWQAVYYVIISREFFFCCFVVDFFFLFLAAEKLFAVEKLYCGLAFGGKRILGMKKKEIGRNHLVIMNERRDQLGKRLNESPETLMSVLIE